MEARKLTADDALATLTELFTTRGCPAHLRSDNGPDFCAKIVREWLSWLDVRTLFIGPKRPWENGVSESLNGTLRNALLDREFFHAVREAEVLIKRGAATLQQGPAAQRIGVPASGSCGGRVAAPYASPSRSARVGGIPELTFRVDQSVGAGFAGLGIRGAASYRRARLVAPFPVRRRHPTESRSSDGEGMRLPRT